MDILPYNWFGGKSAIADLIWQRFGDINYYVEPFFGGGAVYLNRPVWHRKHYEIINDLNGFVVNFWRAVKANPDAILQYTDWMISDIDKHARQQWLVEQQSMLIERLIADPEYYDSKIAGYWVWGINCHIGSKWCDPPISKSRVSLTRAGVNLLTNEEQRGYLTQLKSRLSRTLVTCLDWARACNMIIAMDNHRRGLIGVFLDPPYRQDLRDPQIYANDSADLSGCCRQWCIDMLSRNNVRIALCGLESEHNELELYGYRKVYWKARGGYNNMNGYNDRNTRHLERIWFSPNCLNDQDFGLFINVKE